MQIIARLCISADGYVSNRDGWPAQLADPTFSPGESHGIREFLEGKEAALMGRTTFEPALGAGRWPWPNLDVFVLASRRPPGTPDHVVTESDSLLLGAGMQLTPSLNPETALTFGRSRALPGGSVEIAYSVR